MTDKLLKEIKPGSELFNSEFIERVENRSDSSMDRVRVFFKNGQELSIIRGQFSYGGELGLFEIMPDDNSLFDEDDKNDDYALGYLTIDRVQYYINKIGSIET